MRSRRPHGLLALIVALNADRDSLEIFRCRLATRPSSMTTSVTTPSSSSTCETMTSFVPVRLFEQLWLCLGHCLSILCALSELIPVFLTLSHPLSPFLTLFTLFTFFTHQPEGDFSAWLPVNCCCPLFSSLLCTGDSSGWKARVAISPLSGGHWPTTRLLVSVVTG